MDAKLLLVKCITLLYRESQLPDRTDNSNDLVKTVLDTIIVPEGSIGLNTDKDTLRALKETACEMYLSPPDHEYDSASLLQRLKLNCGYDEKLYEAFEQGILATMDEGSLKRTIVNIRKMISNHFKEQQISDILQHASHKFRFQRDTVGDVNNFISTVIAQLEPLQIMTTSKDPAVMSNIDIGDQQSIASVFNEIKNASDSKGILRSGWQGINLMTQGGFRRGEQIIMPALQHKYKTGFSLSLFQQFAVHNTPYLLNPNRRPLLLRISFEDNITSNIQFVYQKLKFEETGDVIDMRKIAISNEDMASYIKTKLGVNGFSVKMIRVDPTQWSYKSICNKIIELEAEGYEIVALMLDYLGLVPTVGCIAGPAGTDMRDMFRRIRNFCSAKGITVLTPHQLSTEAKQLIRQGIPEDQFVKEINEKGYYAGCKQLDQEVDMEIYLHIFKYQKEWWLSAQRGKHRLPTIVNEDYKYLLMKFPAMGMPIPDDINGDPRYFRSLPRIGASANTEELFAMG